MSELTLYIGNKAYSTWSLRGWLAMKLARLPFEEVVLNMDTPEWPEEIRRISPSAKVPVLKHSGLKQGAQLIWDSLAIAEYAAELAPQAGLWPAERAARAHARTIAAEMHSGFASLRGAMWMNLRRRFPGKGRTPAALADIARILELWRDTRARYGAGGPYLFGANFNLADAMYAPVVSRFVTWEPELPADAKAYVAAAWEHPLMVEWRKAADAEPWIIAKYETPGD